jgi:hypothetical protein
MSNEKEGRWFLVAVSASIPVALVVWSITLSPPFTLGVVSSTALVAWLYRGTPAFRSLTSIVWRVCLIGMLSILGWLAFRFLHS